MGVNNTRKELPMVRLDLVLPLVQGVERLGLKTEPVLSAHSISRATVAADDVFVPVSTMYALVEDLAEFSGDPYFGFNIGDQLDARSWPPLSRAAMAARTVGDYLVCFCLAAGGVASSASFSLETAGERSYFRERRLSDGGVRPRHNDGFTLGYLLGILQPAVGYAWDGRRVVASLCDPAVIPPGHAGLRLAMEAKLGLTLAFPSEWLLLPPSLGGRAAVVGAAADEALSAETSVPDSLRLILARHLHDADLNAERVAELCGLSKRTLARRLQQSGTSLSAEIGALRRARAEQLLNQHELAVADVGARVGYPDPAVFSRAFRRWTGMTPGAYRRSEEAGQSSQHNGLDSALSVI